MFRASEMWLYDIRSMSLYEKIICAHSLKLSMYYLCAGSGLYKSHPTDFDGQGHW